MQQNKAKSGTLPDTKSDGKGLHFRILSLLNCSKFVLNIGYYEKAR